MRAPGLALALLLGIGARLLLAWVGAGRYLSWRPEVSTAANSNLELREGLALYGMGVSPYSGTSCRVPPLALWLYSALYGGDERDDDTMSYVLLNAVFDALAALLLYRLAARLLAAAPQLGPGPEPSSPLVLLDDATPNVGQWWYLSMEAFDDAKAYVRILAHSLLLALAPPLAMRLGRRTPLALFVIQLLALALLKPYPSVADLGLATSLLPLLLLAAQPPAPAAAGTGAPTEAVAAAPADPRVGGSGGSAAPLLLPASLALLCVLGPAMAHMWLSYESANSNFYYSATLLYGGWHVVLLVQPARGKAEA
ncbi:hypothetical protein GPECTOR_26g480 [Gonium pectorale]|uniref:GPI transamidase subunit PIG-U n=1 Tax=Gonium pectorale TaxID=33097 RepID=A0A150GFE5_GONPE|nr:hypothetical protein GPECTOR_26g480 [Gonium pectorale]|eukprot:KXZ48577.1 hypothetical protein GPECTOR_26g480 [Gonium pectorale]